MLLAVLEKLPSFGNRFSESTGNMLIRFWEFRLRMLGIEKLEIRSVNGGAFQESIMRGWVLDGHGQA